MLQGNLKRLSDAQFEDNFSLLDILTLLAVTTCLTVNLIIAVMCFFQKGQMSSVVIKSFASSHQHTLLALL